MKGFFFQTHDNPWQFTCSPRTKQWYAHYWMLQPRIDENVKIKILEMTIQLWTCDYHCSADPSPSTEHSASGDCEPKCLRLIAPSLKLGMYFLQKLYVEWSVVFDVWFSEPCVVWKNVWTSFSYSCLLACLPMFGFRAHNGWWLMGECTAKGSEETNKEGECFARGCQVCTQRG
jgi:hypothetical protein